MVMIMMEIMIMMMMMMTDVRLCCKGLLGKYEPISGESQVPVDDQFSQLMIKQNQYFKTFSQDSKISNKIWKPIIIIIIIIIDSNNEVCV